MKTRIVLDGNAFYEIDEECMRRKSSGADGWNDVNDEQTETEGKKSEMERKRGFAGNRPRRNRR